MIYDELILLKKIAKQNWSTIETDIKKWVSRKGASDKKIKQLVDTLKQRQSDLENILLERIRDREHAEIYTGMIKKCEADIARFKQQLESIRDYESTIRKRKKELKQNIDLIDEIVSAGAISDTHLRMLVDVINISEKEGRLNISLELKAQFRYHEDQYNENGKIRERLFETWWCSTDDEDDYYIPDDEIC